MDRRQKIMRLIIEMLTDKAELTYTYTGALTSVDPNLIALDFVVKKGAIRGELSVRGLIDMPLKLEAQYDNRTMLNDHPSLREQIEQDLLYVSLNVNRLL